MDFLCGRARNEFIFNLGTAVSIIFVFAGGAFCRPPATAANPVPTAHPLTRPSSNLDTNGAKTRQPKANVLEISHLMKSQALKERNFLLKEWRTPIRHPHGDDPCRR